MSEVKETQVAYAVESFLSPLLPVRFPHALAWLQEFDAEEQSDFFQELLAVIAAAMTTGHWNQIAQVVDEWKETAWERADPELQARLRTARQELAEGRAMPWEEAKLELGL